MDNSTPSPMPPAAASMVSSGVGVIGSLNATQVSLIIAGISVICALITTSIAVMRFLDERRYKRAVAARQG